VIGYAFHVGLTETAFSWTQAGGLVALPSLGGPQSEAHALNDEGVIVGASITGGGEVHATLWQPPHDSTPPTLTVPADLSVPATGPNGATVTFQASATDAVDGPVPVSCTPASGSLFAIGDTRVTCTAADSSGNSASAGFTVHVEGAAEQLADLAAAAATVGPGSSIARKVGAARAALGRDNLSATCGVLHALHNELQGGALDADVLRISAVLRC
jgi:HYR domain